MDFFHKQSCELIFIHFHNATNLVQHFYVVDGEWSSCVHQNKVCVRVLAVKRLRYEALGMVSNLAVSEIEK